MILPVQAPPEKIFPERVAQLVDHPYKCRYMRISEVLAGASTFSRRQGTRTEHGSRLRFSDPKDSSYATHEYLAFGSRIFGSRSREPTGVI